MNSSTAAGVHSPRLSGFLQHVDVVQAAEQISRLSTDLSCAFDCVRFVLGELSTVIKDEKVLYHAFTCVLSFVTLQCHRPDRLLYLIDVLYRLSLLSNAFVTEALQRLQAQVIQVRIWQYCRPWHPSMLPVTVEAHAGFVSVSSPDSRATKAAT